MEQKLEAEWIALQESCGAAPLPGRALLRVTGADSTRWLNGMVTNSVAALQPGEGAYSFVLNAQGRIQGDCTVYRETVPAEPAGYLLSTTAAQAEVLQPWLERYIIMDDVELVRAAEDEQSLVLLGPATGTALGSLALSLPEPLRLVHAVTSQGPVLILTPSSGRVPTVELRGAPSILAALRRKLAETGVSELSPETLEAWRIFEGTPAVSQDIRDRDLPQETGQNHALHFAKGCYLGQEIVERIRSRGQVRRVLSRLELAGELPSSLPAPLEDGGKPAGEITSAAVIPSPQGSVLRALGYVRGESLSPSITLTYPGGTAVPLP